MDLHPLFMTVGLDSFFKDSNIHWHSSAAGDVVKEFHSTRSRIVEKGHLLTIQ